MKTLATLGKPPCGICCLRSYLMYKMFVTFGFWATVCKTVRPMLLDCCPVLSVTLVYCDQTVAWIKMKLGVQVGLSPGHIV